MLFGALLFMRISVLKLTTLALNESKSTSRTFKDKLECELIFFCFLFIYFFFDWFPDCMKKKAAWVSLKLCASNAKKRS